jgi:hypothetical protein
MCTATIAVVIIIIIIYYYYYYLVFTNFLIGSQVYFVLDKYFFIFLISRLRCNRIVKLRLRSVNIKLLLQIRSSDLMRNVMLFVLVGM